MLYYVFSLYWKDKNKAEFEREGERKKEIKRDIKINKWIDTEVERHRGKGT